MLRRILFILICCALAMPAAFLTHTDIAAAATKQVKKKAKAKTAAKTKAKATRAKAKTKTVRRATATRRAGAAVSRRRVAAPGISAGDGNTMVWPDPMRTPGATNPDVTQSNIKSTVCKRGWTATIRPPSSYTNGLKTQGIEQYGFADTSLASYEEDHLISLELGGDPENPQNLWPQAYAGVCGARVKDKIETRLKTMVCAGQISLSEAQQEIAQNWVGAYIKYIGEINCLARQ